MVQALPLRESPVERAMHRSARTALDPLTAPRPQFDWKPSARRRSVLLKGLQSKDPEVKFYSAEALAYLDHDKSGEAAPPLGQAARDHVALRVYALTALSAMNSFEAREQLRELLHVRSAETRYGAFRALWAMDATDPLVKGETLGDRFGYHTINTSGPPMIHVAGSFRPEIVVFGNNQRLQTPLVLEAGKNILVTAPANGPVTVSRFAANLPDQKRQVSTRVDDVIRAIVDLEGGYADVVQMLQKASEKNLLADNSRVMVDAVPQPGRRFERKSSTAEGDDNEDEEKSDFVVRSPLPNLFPPCPPAKTSGRTPSKRSSRKSTGSSRPCIERSRSKATTTSSGSAVGGFRSLS